MSGIEKNTFFLVYKEGEKVKRIVYIKLWGRVGMEFLGIKVCNLV